MNENASPAPELCPRCGLKKGQIGSFTYWIFQDDRCQCQLQNSSSQSNASASVPEIDGAKPILNDRYELIECVGQGAIGNVYRAIDLSSGRQVAIKAIRPGLAENELAVQRLIREVSIVSTLHHSNLGRVHGYGQEKDGLPYLVMEFVSGQELAEIIETEGKLSVGRAIDLFIQIASGLDCIHTNKVIHRDLKPNNIIVQPVPSGKERAVIIDFGFAGLLREPEQAIKLTLEGEAFGSPAYMSPEQCLGEALDARSDIYSLGCLMYEVLSGAPPLVGENVLSTVAKQVKEPPSSLRIHDASIPAEVDSIVMKCLAKEPVLRYQTASDLRSDLDKLKKGAYVSTPPVRSRSSRKSSSTQVETTTLRSSDILSGSRIKTLIGIVALVSIVAGGVAGFFVWLFLQGQQTQSALYNRTNFKQVEQGTVTITSGADAASDPRTMKDLSKVSTADSMGESKAKGALDKQGLKPRSSASSLQGASPKRSTRSHSTAQTKRPISGSTVSRKNSPERDSMPSRSSNSVSSSWAQLKQLREHK